MQLLEICGAPFVFQTTQATANKFSLGPKLHMNIVTPRNCILLSYHTYKAKRCN